LDYFDAPVAVVDFVAFTTFPVCALAYAACAKQLCESDYDALATAVLAANSVGYFVRCLLRYFGLISVVPQLHFIICMVCMLLSTYVFAHQKVLLAFKQRRYPERRYRSDLMPSTEVVVNLIARPVSFSTFVHQRRWVIVSISSIVASSATLLHVSSDLFQRSPEMMLIFDAIVCMSVGILLGIANRLATIDLKRIAAGIFLAFLGTCGVQLVLSWSSLQYLNFMEMALDITLTRNVVLLIVTLTDILRVFGLSVEFPRSSEPKPFKRD